jgi:flagellar M-ring protein FliF
MEADSMQAVQKTIQPIIGHIRELPFTAKLLVGSLMVILLMALFLVAQYAGRSTLEALPIPPTGEARTRVISYLQTTGIAHEQRGTEILIPADQRYAVLAQLTDDEVITADEINFDSLIEKDSPFLSRDQNRKRWLVAKMNVLARMINNMSGVDRATVVIGEPDRPGGIGASHVKPTASVTVSATGELTQPQVDAIAQLVAGAHAGLDVDMVSVIDAQTGRHRLASSRDNLAASEYLDLQTNTEDAMKGKIQDALYYIPNVSVAVRAIVDTRREDERIQEYRDPKTGVRSDLSTSTTSTSQGAGGQPGVRPNVVANAPTGGTGASEMSDEKAESEFDNRFPFSQRSLIDRKGYALQINATIGVPRSYFVRLYQQDQNDPSAIPTAAALDVVATQEIDEIKRQIEPLVDTTAIGEEAMPGTVVVRMIPDVALGVVAPDIAPAQASVVVGGGLLLKDWLKYVGLGALVLLSLLMMFLMVRKASAREELPTPEELVGTPPALQATESDVVGEAEESAPALEGLEIEEEELRRQQMLDQINDMVAKNSDEAASLLRRWMKSSA